MVVAVVGVVLELRRRWSVPEERAGALRWIGGAVLVAGVLWLPVAIDQVTGDPGNLTAVARFSGDEGRASLGTTDAVDARAPGRGAAAAPALAGRHRARPDP